MRFDLHSQMILAELKNLYDTDGSYGTYPTLYDFLVKEEHDFGISDERKGELWKKSVAKFNLNEKRIIATWEKEALTKRLHDYYKSSLAAEYLLRVKNETGMTLDIKDEQGNKLSLLTPKPYEE